MRFGSCCSRSFSCRRLSLTSWSTFPNCSSVSFWLQNWLKNFFQFPWMMLRIVLGWVNSFYSYCLAIRDPLFSNFWCSELMLRKVWQYVFFLNTLVFNLLFLIYILISRNEILSFDILYSNLIDGYCVFSLLKIFSRSVLLPVHIKSISSKNLKYIRENVLINGYVNFLWKWFINMCHGASFNLCVVIAIENRVL